MKDKVKSPILEKIKELPAPKPIHKWWEDKLVSLKQMICIRR